MQFQRLHSFISSKMGDSKNPEIWKAVAMADHFEKIQKLPDKIDGVPNFRRVPGYKVYCCGQPTISGFEKVIEKVCGDKYPKDGPIIWINMRQEPIIYINGDPICARPPNKIGEYAELGNVTRASVKADEEEASFLYHRHKAQINIIIIICSFTKFLRDVQKKITKLK